MSRCIYCGNELLTGDFHWQQCICNTCYDKLYGKFDKNYREYQII